jgi:guanylate kinase
MGGILFIISAPSGSGKSTLLKELMRLVPGLEFSVSYTTRSLRGSEQHGHDYFYVSRPEFEKMIANGDFLEHAEVFGNYYGTARKALQEAAARGNDLLLDIDVQGAAQVKAKLPDAVSIFVLPPDRQTLEKRLRNRSFSEGGVSDQEIERRLVGASKEIENFRKYDYILVNEHLEESVDHLRAIVLCERAKKSGKGSSPDQQRFFEMAQRCAQANADNQRLSDILESFSRAISG